MNISKICLSVLLLFLLISPVLGQDSFNAEYSVIEPRSFEGTYNISPAENPEIEDNGNEIFFSFKADVEGLSENQALTVRIDDNRSWYENISRNSVSGFKGEKVESTNTFTNNDSFELNVDESGKYYLIGLESTSTWDFYRSNGECRIVLSPDSSDYKVESCESSIINNIKYNLDKFADNKLISLVLGSLALLTVLYYFIPFFLEKIVIRKNNNVMKKATKLKDPKLRNESLKDLLDADEKALNGEYLKALRIIRDIDSKIS